MKPIIINIFDNGGETADRYTVAFQTEAGPGVWTCLVLSANPESPQGISLFSTCKVGPHLGKRVKLHQLPENVQKHIQQRIA